MIESGKFQPYYRCFKKAFIIHHLGNGGVIEINFYVYYHETSSSSFSFNLPFIQLQERSLLNNGHKMCDNNLSEKKTDIAMPRNDSDIQQCKIRFINIHRAFLYYYYTKSFNFYFWERIAIWNSHNNCIPHGELLLYHFRPWTNFNSMNFFSLTFSEFEIVNF